MTGRTDYILWRWFPLPECTCEDADIECLWRDDRASSTDPTERMRYRGYTDDEIAFAVTQAEAGRTPKHEYPRGPEDWT